MKSPAPAIFLILILCAAPCASVQWSYSAQGAITGKPLIFPDRAVFSTYEGKIYGFSADRGSVLWLYDGEARLAVPVAKVSPDLLAAANTEGKLAFITSAGKETASVALPSPALYLAGASGTAYVSLKGGVRAYSSSGKSIWNITLASPAGPLSVFGDTVYFTSGGKLHSVSAKTGVHDWVADAEDSFMSAPVESGGSVYFGATDGRLYAFDAVSGRQRWSYPTGGWVQSTPAVAGDSVFFGSDDGGFYSVTDSGKLRFSFRAGQGVWAEPALYSSGGRQFAVFGSNDGNVYGIDAATGAQVWSFSAGGRVGPAAEKGGAFLFGTSSGKFYSLLLSPICSFSWPLTGAAAGDWPVAAEGTAYSDSGVQQVEVRLEGGSWQTASGKEKWRADLDFTGLPYGAYKAECRVSDASGTQSSDYASITLLKTQNVQLQRMSVSAPPYAESNQTISISARDSRGAELAGATLSVSGEKKTGDSPFSVVLGRSGAIPVTIEKPGFEPVSFVINSTGGPDLLFPLLAVLALAVAAFLAYRRMSAKKVA